MSFMAKKIVLMRCMGFDQFGVRRVKGLRAKWLGSRVSV
jgi:hypothetical protein